MNICVLNAGSTSLKFGLFDPAQNCRCIFAGSLDWPKTGLAHALLTLKGNSAGVTQTEVALSDFTDAVRIALDHTVTDKTCLVVHRIVLAGAEYTRPAFINTEVKRAIQRWSALAPLHNGPALLAIEAVSKVHPQLPQAAVFDTAFFSSLPAASYVEPLPYAWLEKYGVRRFGFHGISNAYCAGRIREILGDSPADKPRRQITCHLGGGCSATAVLDQEPVATTMDFSPLGGLPMGTRPGSMDPGILLYLQQEHGVPLGELEHALNYESGLKGISGISADLTLIEQAAQEGNARAQLAFAIFSEKIRSAIGGLIAALGGLDVLVFTDRIGQSSSLLRKSVCRNLRFVGLELDLERNEHCEPDNDIATPGSAVRVFVIKNEEEFMMAKDAWAALGKTASDGGK